MIFCREDILCSSAGPNAVDRIQLHREHSRDAFDRFRADIRLKIQLESKKKQSHEKVCFLVEIDLFGAGQTDMMFMSKTLFSQFYLTQTGKFQNFLYFDQLLYSTPILGTELMFKFVSVECLQTDQNDFDKFSFRTCQFLPGKLLTVNSTKVELRSKF